MSDDGDELDAELVMPFLPVHSQGGPWDDAAYSAGWEMGAIDTRLAAAPGELIVTVQEDNRAQADLVAMRHGYRAEFQHTDVAGWVFMRFTRVSVPDPGEVADA